jgi:hypothetical protein
MMEVYKEAVAWIFVYTPFLLTTIAGGALCAQRRDRRGAGLVGLGLVLLALTLIGPFCILLGMTFMNRGLDNGSALLVFGFPILTATIGVNLLFAVAFDLQRRVAEARPVRPEPTELVFPEDVSR